MASHDIAGSLARYREAGKLFQVQDPIARAAELLIADPTSIGVAMNAEAERRLRETVQAQLAAAETSQAGTSAERAVQVAASDLNRTSDAEAATSQPVTSQESQRGTPANLVEDERRDDPWASRIVQADPAYEARRQRREAWIREDPSRATSHKPEPDAPSRAYVVAGHLGASRELTRAVSVAAESHLLTTPLRPWLAQEVELAATRLATADEPEASSVAQTEEQARRQAELHRELAYERRDHERTPGAERGSERARESEAGR
jgi:hypothetical protein